MRFREGTISRTGVHPSLHQFCPVMMKNGIQSVLPGELAANGKKLVLLDADNTLLEWRAHEVPELTQAWVKQAKEAGLNLCLISNARSSERLKRMSENLGIPYVRGKFKPSRDMFELALEMFSAKPEEAIMIGDQVFTDIWGANRAGIEAILLKPLHNKEFVGTKFNRFLESMVLKRLMAAMEAEPDDLPIVQHGGIFQRRIVRQLAKFCIVGGSSFIMDWMIRLTLYEKASSGGQLISESIGAQIHQALPPALQYAHSPKEFFFPLAALAGTAIGLLNSFYWNRRWTFSIVGDEDRGKQFRKFLVISLSGMVLNIALSMFFNHAVPGDERMRARAATVLAAGLVAVWNFLGQRLYAFRVKPSE